MGAITLPATLLRTMDTAFKSFTPNLTSNAHMSGYGFDSPYIFGQLHFHWGPDPFSGGSEHTINGAHLPMEAHFVHYDSKYPSYTDAANSGIVFLAH
jgi:carbonic anhydrase